MTRKIEDTVSPNKGKVNTAFTCGRVPFACLWATNGSGEEVFQIAALFGGGYRFILDDPSDIYDYPRGTMIFITL
jgi:hypothetical protein